MIRGNLGEPLPDYDPSDYQKKCKDLWHNMLLWHGNVTFTTRENVKQPKYIQWWLYLCREEGDLKFKGIIFFNPLYDR